MRHLQLAAVFTAIACLSACDLAEAVGGGQRFREPFDYAYDLKPGGRFTIEGFNGSVEITGWDRDRVEIHGEKYASDRSRLDDIQIDILHTADVVSVKASRPGWTDWSGNAGVKFMVHLPRKVVLGEVKTSNGPISVEGTEGRARLLTSNGPLKVRDLKGDLDARTSNGPLTISGFSGALVAQTSNGPINADGVEGVVDVTTSNGPVDVSAAGLDSSRPVKIRTSNGPVRLALDKVNTDVQVRSSNGPINLKVPESGMYLMASTSSGRVRSEFPVGGQTESKSELAGRIGAGGPTVNLRTSNSNIQITRR